MKLVISLSLPRCRSVALLLSVTNGKSFDICLHEPTIRPYCEVKFKGITKDWFIGGFNTFKEYEDYLLQNTNKSIFIKDMIFSCENWIIENISKYKDAIILLWIRNPYESLISVYNKLEGDNPNPRLENTSNYRNMYNVYMKLRDKNKVYILDMDELVGNPKEYLSKVSLLLNLKEFGTYNWDKFNSKLLEGWKESKTLEQVKHWHGDALDSTGFISSKVREIDFKGVKLEDLDYIKNLYTNNLYYYSLLKNEKQK